MNLFCGLTVIVSLLFSLISFGANASSHDCLQDYFTGLFTRSVGNQTAVLAYPKTDSQRISLHQKMWSSDVNVRGVFAAMIEHERFECAELAFSDLDRPGIVFSNGMSKTLALLKSADDVVDHKSGMTVSEIDELIARWKKQPNNSIFPDIYWSYLLHSAAWQARGGGAGNEVSAEQWKRFRLLNEAAKVRLDLASPEAKAHFLWRYPALWVMADTGVPQSKIEDFALQSFEKFPDQFHYVFLPAERLTSRWGGNDSKFETYAQKVLSKTRSNYGSSIYSKLYMSYYSNVELLKNRKLNIDILRTGLIESAQQSFSAEAFNDLQNFACIFHDKTSLRAAGDLWISYSPDERSQLFPMDASCRTWSIQALNNPATDRERSK